MSEIKSFGLIICILMVLMAYLKQVIPKGKTNLIMKVIISVFILLSVVDGILEFDFSVINDLQLKSYSRNSEVWSKAEMLIEDGLRRELENYIKSEGVNAEVREVMVSGEYDSFTITKVILSGSDAEKARNLLAGRYQIGIAYIEVKNE